MGTFFERLLELDRIERVTRVLEIQTEAYGYIDVPVLSDALGPYENGSLLDVGTGEGSFLIEVAQRHPHMRVQGLEPNAAFLARAQARLQDRALPNVQLTHGVFDASHAHRHDVIVARFTLQHVPEPQDFIQSVYRALHPDGLFVCIEPVYDYFGSTSEEAIWETFREKMLATYRQWGSYPNLPKQICPWLAEAGFTSISAAIHLYSPITIGRERFAAVILATAAMLHAEHPSLWDAAYLERLADWIQRPASAPFISIAHIRAFKGNDPTGQHLRVY